MNKCCFDVITIWHCFSGSGSDWGLIFSHYLCSYNINTFSSFIISSSSTSLSTSVSIGKLGPLIPNVNDGQCLSFEIYVPWELETSLNVDVSVLLKTLILTLKHIFIYFSSKILQHFLHWKFKGLKNKVSTRSNKYELIYVQWMLIIICGLFIHIFSYRLTHCKCSFSVWNLSKFRKFNSGWCLGL